MKKILALLLALMLTLTGIACAENLDFTAMSDEELASVYHAAEAEILRRENAAKDAAAQAIAPGSIIFEHPDQEMPRLIYESEDQLRQCLRKVVLTPENWNQYLGDYYFAYNDEEINNFGEVAKTTERRIAGFTFRPGYVGDFENVGLKLTGQKELHCSNAWNEDKTYKRITNEEWVETNETVTLDITRNSTNNLSLEDYKCIAATGIIYVLEAPQEAWDCLILPPNMGFCWVYAGDTYMGSTDNLGQVYEKLNP